MTLGSYSECKLSSKANRSLARSTVYIYFFIILNKMLVYTHYYIIYILLYYKNDRNDKNVYSM